MSKQRRDTNTAVKSEKPFIFSPSQISMKDQRKTELSSALNDRRQTASTREGGRHSYPLDAANRFLTSIPAYMSTLDLQQLDQEVNGTD